MTKAEIRNYVASQKTGMGLPILEANGFVAVKRLKRQQAYLDARRIGAYAPLPDDVDIARIMTDPERTFYIPAFDEDRGIYRFARMAENFRRNRFGGVEPTNPVFAEENELDLILVPGLAFAHSGERIGREEECYAELLPLYHARLVGICFDFQCMETIPFDEQDLQMDMIITESKCIEIVYEE
jgi:5-formyltetrahydrofolate cyclo-ligase